MAYIYKNGKVYAGGGGGGDGMFNDMDAQELEVFLSGIEAEGPNLVDYVIEQGEDNYWTYRKWNSGVAEAWRSDSGTASQAGTINSWYYRENSYNLPSIFISAPTVVSSGKWGTGVSLGSTRAITDTTVTVTLLSNQSGTTGFDVNMHAIGRWK